MGLKSALYFIKSGIFYFTVMLSETLSINLLLILMQYTPDISTYKGPNFYVDVKISLLNTLFFSYKTCTLNTGFYTKRESITHGL